MQPPTTETETAAIPNAAPAAPNSSPTPSESSDSVSTWNSGHGAVLSDEPCPDCGERMLQTTVPGTKRKVFAHCCAAQREADAREWERRRALAVAELHEREARLP